jgi:transketolase
MSVADIIAALYFSIMRVDPVRPRWSERDRLVLSKGHSCPVLYAALARRGFFPIENLPTLRSLGSILQGHPDMNKTPGIDMTSGSLGNGLSLGLGIAAAGLYNGNDFTTFVILGDGELEEGLVWEAAMAAVHIPTLKLIAIIDNNGYQSGGTLSQTSGIEPIAEKWSAFGWHCQQIDGHDCGGIIDAVNNAKKIKNQPSVIIAKTIKGKGVSFMEGDNSWHKRTPTEEELKRALAEIRRTAADE